MEMQDRFEYLEKNRVYSADFSTKKSGDLK